MYNVEVAPDIYWVGVVDFAVRDFHGYVTPKGSSYNNYLITGGEITLVDAVKHDFIDLGIDNIKRLTDPAKIKHIVVNHVEPDHGGGLAEVISLSPTATIHCTEKARQGLDRMFDISGWKFNIVKTGDTLNIGNKTLMFLETPMLHWPDSMMTYVREDKLLFSQDAFGQHVATTQRFDDELLDCLSLHELEDSIWDYYANILMPFGALIKSKLAEVQKLGIEIKTIAPDHGIIWRSHPEKVLGMYSDIANGMALERVAIIYDTMWHSTEKMIQPIMEGLRTENMECHVIKLRSTPTSVAVKEFWKSRGCLIGSPTLNNTLFPQIAEFLATLHGLRPRHRIVSAFGSYGWGGGAVKEILETARGMKLETMEPGVQVKYKATVQEEEQLYQFGREFANKTRQYHAKF